MVTELVGWSAAGLLLLTMVRQVWSQWQSGAVGGVSHWLFVGQLGASSLFTLYSLLLGSLVFTVTNVLMMLNALVGLCIDRRNRARRSHRAAQEAR